MRDEDTETRTHKPFISVQANKRRLKQDREMCRLWPRCIRQEGFIGMAQAFYRFRSLGNVKMFER